MFICFGTSKIDKYPHAEDTRNIVQVNKSYCDITGSGEPCKQKTQLKDCRNSSGERLVLFLNSLLNDCGYSKPSW